MIHPVFSGIYKLDAPYRDAAMIHGLELHPKHPLHQEGMQPTKIVPVSDILDHKECLLFVNDRLGNDAEKVPSIVTKKQPDSLDEIVRIQEEKAALVGKYKDKTNGTLRITMDGGDAGSLRHTLSLNA